MIQQVTIFLKTYISHKNYLLSLINIHRNVYMNEDREYIPTILYYHYIIQSHIYTNAYIIIHLKLNECELLWRQNKSQTVILNEWNTWFLIYSRPTIPQHIYIKKNTNLTYLPYRIRYRYSGPLLSIKYIFI